MLLNFVDVKLCWCYRLPWGQVPGDLSRNICWSCNKVDTFQPTKLGIVLRTICPWVCRSVMAQLSSWGKKLSEFKNYLSTDLTGWPDASPPRLSCMYLYCSLLLRLSVSFTVMYEYTVCALIRKTIYYFSIHFYWNRNIFQNSLTFLSYSFYFLFEYWLGMGTC